MDFSVDHLNLFAAGFAAGVGIAAIIAKHKNSWVYFALAFINIFIVYGM